MSGNIIELIQQLVAAHGELNILTEYKGLSISSPAAVLKVTQSTIEVQTDRFLAVSMATDKFALLESSFLPEIVHAEVAHVDLPNQRASLAGFKYADNRTSKREIVRVKPKDEVSGEIKDRHYMRSARGELADISQEGVAIYIPKAEFKSWQFNVDSQVTIHLRLPGEFTIPLKKTGVLPSNSEPMDRFSRSSVRFNPVDTRAPTSPGSGMARITNPQIEIHATIKNVRLEAAHFRYRVGMQIERGDACRNLIAQFIAQRQSEVIREIREMYDLLMQNRKE